MVGAVTLGAGVVTRRGLSTVLVAEEAWVQVLNALIAALGVEG